MAHKTGLPYWLILNNDAHIACHKRKCHIYRHRATVTITSTTNHYINNYILSNMHKDCVRLWISSWNLDMVREWLHTLIFCWPAHMFTHRKWKLNSALDDQSWYYYFFQSNEPNLKKKNRVWLFFFFSAMSGIRYQVPRGKSLPNAWILAQP